MHTIGRLPQVRPVSGPGLGWGTWVERWQMSRPWSGLQAAGMSSFSLHLQRILNSLLYCHWKVDWYRQSYTILMFQYLYCFTWIVLLSLISNDDFNQGKKKKKKIGGLLFTSHFLTLNRLFNTLQSIVIFRGSFLIFEGSSCISGAKSPGAPCIFPPEFNVTSLHCVYSSMQI